MAAGNVLLDPVVHAQMVEVLPELRGTVVQRGKRSLLELILERLANGNEILQSLRVQLVVTMNVVGVLGALRWCRERSHQRQGKPLRQGHDRLEVPVDPLSAPLAGLAAGRIATALAVHAA